MKIRSFLLASMATAMLALVPAGAQETLQSMKLTLAPLPVMPQESTRTGKRINRVVEVWSKGQPVYYTSTDEGAASRMAGRWPAPRPTISITAWKAARLDFHRAARIHAWSGRCRYQPVRPPFPAVIVTLPIPGTLRRCAPMPG